MNPVLHIQNLIKKFSFILSFIFRGQSRFKNLEVILFSQFQILNIMSGLFLFTTRTGPWITEFIPGSANSPNPVDSRIFNDCSVLYDTVQNNCERRMRNTRRWFKNSVWRPRIWVERIWKRMFSSCGLTSKHKCRKAVTNFACVINPTGSNWFTWLPTGFKNHPNYHMYFMIVNPISTDLRTTNITFKRPPSPLSPGKVLEVNNGHWLYYQQMIRVSCFVQHHGWFKINN